MAFTGKPGNLTIEELLGIIHSSSEKRALKVTSSTEVYYVSSENRRVTGISHKGHKGELVSVLISRGLLSSEYEALAGHSETNKKLSEKMLLEMDALSDDIMESARLHLAESIFFDFLALKNGQFEWLADDLENTLKFDPLTADWFAELLPNISLAKKFRSSYPDFDQRLYWLTPSNGVSIAGDMQLNEIRLLSRYQPSITIRKYLALSKDYFSNATEMLIRLQEKNILTCSPPGKEKQPNSKPFLRAMLATVVDTLLRTQELIGKNGEILEILKLIENNLSVLSSVSPDIQMPQDSFVDLSSIAGSLDGLLDLNGIEELNLQEEMKVAEPPAKPSRQVRKPTGKPTGTPGVKAGVKRQPVKTDKSLSGYEEVEEVIKTRGELKHNPKRDAEADRIIAESANAEREGASMEEKVESKVRYRHFMSNVTMAFNRFVFTNQTLFELFGLVPNADKKTIHKAFVKAIDSINPKGIPFKRLDKPVVEKAIFLRDLYKYAYMTLMDTQRRAKYLDGMRAGRKQVEENREQAMRMFNQGMDRVRKGKFDEARAIFKQASKLDPNSPVFYSVLEDIDKEEREGNAVKFFQAGILAVKQKNDLERAVKLIRKAISLRPLDPTYHLKLAEIQMMSGTYKADAVDSYLRALDLDPGNHDLRLTIANLLRNLGRKQEAANMYQEILKWTPENALIKKNLIDLKKEGIAPEQSETQKKKEKKDTVVNEEFE
jgi:tetratricopeptide (TPR) repeat protein